MATITGTADDDRITGTADSDFIDISQGGDDVVKAGAGDDEIFVGGALTAEDRINGGGGANTLWLFGDYSSGIVFGAQTMRNIDFLDISAGDFTLNDANVGAGETLGVVSMANSGEATRFDGSSETDGRFRFDFNAGAIDVKGGQQDDFFMLAGPNADALTIDGGGGTDTMFIDPIFGGAVYDFSATTMTGIEVLQVEGSATVVTDDDNVAAGQVLRVEILGQSGVDAWFDGHQETDGAFSISGAATIDDLIGGAGDDTIFGAASGDTLIGGGGNDHLQGGKWSDVLSGGAGDDIFEYHGVTESSRKAPDLITDLAAGDTIDLTAIDARTDKAGDQAFHIVEGFTHVSGQLVISYETAEDVTTFAGDVNGDGKADLVIQASGDHTDFTGWEL